eukprot:TRINITY_DN4741_c0_g1_i6.p2 TRINITY_DN4741_c0_g1~~TRINITY_DN4741_c0_g1_i6.p2  ORF type:complete len:220 (+),score=21.30 TRINITY_DN4741_c0_g1_i6:213-872(+)
MDRDIERHGDLHHRIITRGKKNQKNMKTGNSSLLRRVNFSRKQIVQPRNFVYACSKAERLQFVSLRRQILVAVPFICTVHVKNAGADVLQDLGRKFLREDTMEPIDAIVDVIFANNTLQTLKTIAALPKDSDERTQYESYYPGMAKRLRLVAQAAPVVADIVNQQGENNLSVKYGGNLEEGQGVVDSLFEAVGRVLTLSGRTIREEARYDPAFAQQGIT